MNKSFEDCFSELQADMVSICLEYVKNRADKIFIYCSFESDIISSDYYYKINGRIVERHKLNDAVLSSEKYDVSIERQRGVIKILNGNIGKIIEICKEYGREMPTEMKLVYDVQKNSLKATYKYELQYANDPVKTADDIAMEWFQQIQAENS
ncbi:Hypothetical protein LUCI_5204 [Lucifera butyrica]|uniref:DUF600 domain-containing protein n=1 Tax=Lucifera butyrica TaxID=1351585 RepID=A0A498RAZ0_9FIRM|nr:DUF600 domain-containing protein [Lucifera butyrica]VBB09906.1 Hypothetical protein LUCI_5204 [Lucifera butyrica]